MCMEIKKHFWPLTPRVNMTQAYRMAIMAAWHKEECRVMVAPIVHCPVATCTIVSRELHTTSMVWKGR